MGEGTGSKPQCSFCNLPKQMLMAGTDVHLCLDCAVAAVDMMSIADPVSPDFKRGLRDGKAAGREEALEDAAKLAESTTIPAVLPDRSRSTWAGKNYCGGWRQAQHHIACAIRKLRRSREGKG